MRAIYCGRWDCEGHVEQGRDPKSIAANITLKPLGSSGTKITTVSLTCEDVLATRKWYLNQVSDFVQAFLASPTISSYRRSHGLVDGHQSPLEDHADRLNLIANVSPPGDKGTWFQQVDHLIIMDDTWTTGLLFNAVVKAIGWSVGGNRSNDRACETCIPGDSVAARGGALLALEWDEKWIQRRKETSASSFSH